ncbi:CDGSH iron-sulfur domain-containing protein 3, mitochondrial-like [Homarus americanus]|uniref:CDGSH iron-sulfur domain-containing protein 3-like n=1 Tax=Homarus americanus TaxID=6706 RepID=A0A8J5TNM6_HOMAM|nr:CDGSH iron-sulfur domain-containing protein 3, mitochondrial-like [Homarus americanus]KAG7176012.1 CDGSH iron-sulfur domain-containing protein 3-like [Homarus americanus]
MAASRTLTRLPGLFLQSRTLYTSAVTRRKAIKRPDMELNERLWQLEFHQKEKGKIYDKKPFKITLKQGKKYLWCACGSSKSQPMCDGTHLNTQLKINQKPLVFVSPETKEVWLCNCKQTRNPPFCDGTHRTQDVQLAIKD